MSLTNRAGVEPEKTGTYTSDEMMTVAAARSLPDGAVCFVGIGAPSTAANLARATHSPRLVLVYESGTIGAKPARLPLSIGDGELADTADSVVSVPEIFAAAAITCGKAGAIAPGTTPSWTAGGCQVPSPAGRIEGGVSFGQYRRITR